VRPRRPWWRWFAAAIGPGALVALFAGVGVESILAVLRHADPRLVLASLLLGVPALLLRSWRWRILLASDGAGMSFGEVNAIFAYSVFVGTATPGRLGEFFKLVHLTRRGVQLGRALASVLLDRLLDVALLLVAAAASVALLAGGPDLVVALGALVAFVAALWLSRQLVCGAPARLAARLLAPLTPARLCERVATIRAGLCAALDELRAGALLASGALTVAAWGVNYLGNTIMAWSIGLPLGVMDIAAVTAVASLVSLLPVSVMGAGTRDVAMVAMLAAYGVGQAEALALSTLFLVFILWNAVMCGAVAALRPGGGLRGPL
jgi:hypothetical protein